MVSLQQSVNQTEAAIRKASSGSSGQIQADANRSSGAVGKAMTSVRKKVSDAFKGAGKSAGRHLKDIGRRVNGLSRSVKSAFKSAFLMAGLYAAFRGIKSLIGDAVGQNKEFAASLNLIKANLLTAFTPIVQAVQPALNALASGFAAVSQRIAAATAGLFGQTYAQAAASAKKMQAATKEAKKTAGALAGFDELNILGGSGKEDAGVGLDALDGDDAARIDSAMEQIYNNDKPQIKHIGYKRYGLQTLLTGIYIDSEGWLYFGIEMRNDSRIPFDIDHIRMYVRDKRLPRRTAVQDIEIVPVRRLHPLSEIDTGKTGRTVWAIPKMTIPDGKALHIDIYERGGGRHQSLRVENRDILAAKPIPESR